MAWARSPTIRLMYRSLGVRDITSMPGISRSYSVSRLNRAFLLPAVRVSVLSPGIIYEPYEPCEPISFWRRWFTRSGWRRTKEDFIMELKNAYGVAKLRKSTGYSKQKYFEEGIELYKELNLLIANGDKTSLRKAVTENMYSALKKEIRQKESKWSSVYWELIKPVVKIQTLHPRMMGIDKNDHNKAFVQLTLEFVTKQKLEAYDSNYDIVAGDKMKEVLVRDIWVFERSLCHPGSYWQLCGKISLLHPRYERRRLLVPFYSDALMSTDAFREQNFEPSHPNGKMSRALVCRLETAGNFCQKHRSIKDSDNSSGKFGAVIWSCYQIFGSLNFKM